MENDTIRKHLSNSEWDARFYICEVNPMYENVYSRYSRYRIASQLNIPLNIALSMRVCGEGDELLDEIYIPIGRYQIIAYVRKRTYDLATNTVDLGLYIDVIYKTNDNL